VEVVRVLENRFQIASQDWELKMLRDVRQLGLPLPDAHRDRDGLLNLPRRSPRPPESGTTHSSCARGAGRSSSLAGSDPSYCMLPEAVIAQATLNDDAMGDRADMLRAQQQRNAWSRALVLPIRRQNLSIFCVLVSSLKIVAIAAVAMIIGGTSEAQESALRTGQPVVDWANRGNRVISRQIPITYPRPGWAVSYEPFTTRAAPW
jgi:hypothetical protein